MRFKILKRILESKHANKNVNEMKDKLDKIMETAIIQQQNTYKKREMLKQKISVLHPEPKPKNSK